MNMKLPARIRRMSKRRQLTGLYRQIKRGIERALHRGYRGHIVTDEMRARMFAEINNQLRMLPQPVEHIKINLMVLPYKAEMPYSKDSPPRSDISC